MMGDAHIAAGAAAALLVSQPESAGACLAAIAAGAAGGVIADCDVKSSRARRDALLGRLAVAGIAAGALAADFCMGTGLCDAALAHLGARTVAGVAAFAALTFAGARTEHRSFTHSLAGMAAFCVAAWLAFPPLAHSFAAGYASHLALDLANKKGVRLLWPSKAEFALGLCRADGAANAAVTAIGTVAACLAFAMQSGMARPLP